MRALQPLVVVLLYLAVASCTAKPTTADVVGIWRSDRGATVVLEEDGRVFFRNVPRAYLLGEGSSEPISANGKWRLPKSTDRWNQWWDLDVDLNLDRRFSTSISYWRDGGEPSLFLWRGDPDQADRIFFKRVKSDDN